MSAAGPRRCDGGHRMSDWRPLRRFARFALHFARLGRRSTHTCRHGRVAHPDQERVMQISRRELFSGWLAAAAVVLATPAAAATATTARPATTPKRARRRRRVCRWQGNRRVCRYEYRPELILRQW